MAQADGSIIIDTKIDTSGLSDAEREWKKVFGKVSDSVEDMGDSVNDAASDAAKGLKKAGEAADDYAKQADKAAFKEMFAATALSGLAVEALKEAGQAIKDFVVGSVEAAADIKASNSQFSETFKDLERTATKSLKQIEKKTGTTASRMQSSYTKIFAFSKTIGAESAEALDISNRAMLAAADSAAYYDKSLEETVETLQSFLKGNFENDAALGIAATETTRNAMANKIYAKSFIELSEAQKTDVLLSMVEAGNQASGALGQAAREADSWTNSTGELSEAMRQLQAVIGSPIMEALTPIVQGITKAIYDMIEVTAADKLQQNLDGIVETFEDAEKQFEKTAKQTKVNATVAKSFVKRLKELEAAGLDTADAQKKYATTVQALNQIMPELNLSIDEQTGLVNMETAAIEDQIEAMRERAMVAAYEDMYTEAVKAQAEAMVVLTDAQAQLTEMEAERMVIEGQMSEVLSKQTEDTANLAAETLRANAALVGVPESVLASISAYDYLSNEQQNLTNQLSGTISEQTKLNNTIEEAQAAYDQYGEEIARNEKAMGGFIPRTEQAAEAMEGAGAAADDVVASLEELDAQYQEAERSARSSIDSQVGYFSELKKTSSDSAEKIIKNWDSQKEAFDRYTGNLEKAVDMGLDETLVQQLSDGSTESMAILDEFVNGTDTSVDDINAAWKRMNESRQTVSQAMAAIQTDVEKKLGQMVDDAKAAGIDTVKAMASKIEGNKSYVTRAMQELAQAAISAYNRTISNGKYKTPSGGSTNAKNAGMSTYSVSTVVAQTAAVATAEPMAQLMTTMATISPNTPMLAAGTIIPPNSTTSGASTFARPSASYSGNDAKQMLAMGEDVVRSNIVGHEATVDVLSQILEAVLSIELDGETLTKSVERYQRKRAVCRG